MNVEVYLNSLSFCETLIFDQPKIFDFRAHVTVEQF